MQGFEVRQFHILIFLLMHQETLKHGGGWTAEQSRLGSVGGKAQDLVGHPAVCWEFPLVSWRTLLSCDSQTK